MGCSKFCLYCNFYSLNGNRCGLHKTTPKETDSCKDWRINANFPKLAIPNCPNCNDPSIHFATRKGGMYICTFCGSTFAHFWQLMGQECKFCDDRAWYQWYITDKDLAYPIQLCGTCDESFGAGVDASKNVVTRVDITEFVCL